MRKQILSFVAAALAFSASAQSVTATWQLSDPDNLQQATVTGDADYLPLVSTSFALGDKIARTRVLERSGADTGHEIHVQGARTLRLVYHHPAGWP